MRRFYVFLLGIGNIQTQFSVEKFSYHSSVFSVDRILYRELSSTGFSNQYKFCNSCILD